MIAATSVELILESVISHKILLVLSSKIKLWMSVKYISMCVFDPDSNSAETKNTLMIQREDKNVHYKGFVLLLYSCLDCM